MLGRIHNPPFSPWQGSCFILVGSASDSLLNVFAFVLHRLLLSLVNDSHGAQRASESANNYMLSVVLIICVLLHIDGYGA